MEKPAGGWFATSPSLLDKRCLDVLHASTVADFKKQMVSYAQHLGFENVGAMVVTEHSPTLTEFQTITNAPDAYLSEFANLAHTKSDPVLQYCKRSSSPLVWDRRNYSDAGLDELWQLQEPFGYRSGLAVAMHLRRGRHFIIGVNWSKDRCDKVAHFKTIAEDFLSFANHAQPAAFELTLPSKVDPHSSLSLAARELEALRWTMDGMNSWQVAEKMSISERHVTLLLRRTMQKLECSTKHECGLRAIQLGLVDGQ